MSTGLRIGLLMAAGGALVVLLSWWIGWTWGSDGRIVFLLLLVFAYAAMSAAEKWQLRRYAAELRSMDREDAEVLLAEDPEIAREINDILTDRVWRVRGWNVLDGVLAIMFLVIPPALVSVLRYQPISPRSPFTGWHLLALVAGVFAYIPVHGFLWQFADRKLGR